MLDGWLEDGWLAASVIATRRNKKYFVPLVT